RYANVSIYGAMHKRNSKPFNSSTHSFRPEVISQIRRSPKGILQKRYEELGPLSFHELAVCVMFVILIGLWMFRDPQFMNGWSTLLGGTMKVDHPFMNCGSRN